MDFVEFLVTPSRYARWVCYRLGTERTGPAKSTPDREKSMNMMQKLICGVVLATTGLGFGGAARAQQMTAWAVDGPGTIFNLFQAYYLSGFEHFEGDDDGYSLRNQLLLSHLSMIVYTDDLNLGDFEDYLAVRLAGLGGDRRLSRDLHPGLRCRGG